MLNKLLVLILNLQTDIFFRVGIERTEGESPNPYAAATFVNKPAPAPAPAPAETPAKVVEESSSDSD